MCVPACVLHVLVRLVPVPDPPAKYFAERISGLFVKSTGGSCKCLTEWEENCDTHIRADTLLHKGRTSCLDAKFFEEENNTSARTCPA